MATRYLRSTDGSDSDGGTTWALAKATLAGIDAIDTAGDTIYVSQVHSEEFIGAITISLAGTKASPTRLICGNDGAEPPTATALTATIGTGSTNQPFQINSTGFVYVYGIIFKAGVGATSSGTTLQLTAGAGFTTYEKCQFWIPSTGGFASCGIGGTSSSATMLKNCDYKPAVNTHRVTTAGNVRWIGGAILSGSAAVTGFLDTSAASIVYVEGFDFSNGASTMYLCSSTRPNDRIVFNRCKLPSGWSGSLNSGTTGDGSIIEMINCDAGATQYKYWRDTANGNVKDETTIVRTGGGTDGTTPIAYKLTTSANAKWQDPLVMPLQAIWNDTTGASVTVTVYGIWGGGAVPNNDDIWISVRYLGSSATPLGSISDTNTKVDILTANAAQATDSSTWGGSTTKFKMSATITPQMKGWILPSVCAGKASDTFYIDAKPVLS